MNGPKVIDCLMSALTPKAVVVLSSHITHLVLRRESTCWTALIRQGSEWDALNMDLAHPRADRDIIR